jgi:hypothetical protein
MARVSAESILVHQKSPWRTSDSRSIPAVAGGSILHLAVVPLGALRREAMLEPEAVSALLRLNDLVRVACAHAWDRRKR